jgi:hypothetical protein
MLICFCARTDPQHIMMREMFRKKLPPMVFSPSDRPDVEDRLPDTSTTDLRLSHPVNYLSDLSDDDADIDDKHQEVCKNIFGIIDSAETQIR